MFSCKMKKGISDFKNVFDLYSQIGMTDVCFDLKRTGIYIYTTYDKSVHAMAYFNHSTFQEYACEKENVFSLNIKSMRENLKNITSVDVIEMSVNNGTDLAIKVIKKTIEFEKIVSMKENQNHELPMVLDQVEPLTLKSSDFLELCRSINGKYNLWIKTATSSSQIVFESEKNKVVIKSTPEVSTDDYEDNFKAEYFSKMKKFTKFDSNIRVHVNRNQPLLLESYIGGGDKDRLNIWIKSLKQLDDDYVLE